ncbi:hypothetical protein PI124_g2050 [Phytophthora idaei]|nr:hypothetical protein PI124_g2050 [Phytophthora idaei]
MHKHDCKTEKFLRTLYGDCYDPDDTFVYEFVIPYNYSALEAAATLEEKEAGSMLRPKSYLSLFRH